MPRGTYKFEVSGDGDLENSAVNVSLLRKLLLERKMIKGDDLGPGDPGDFDHGAWHVACPSPPAAASTGARMAASRGYRLRMTRAPTGTLRA